MITPPPKTFYLAIDGELLRDGRCPPLRVGSPLAAALCATPHRLSASYSHEPKLVRLGNCLYRIRGRIRTAGPGGWILGAHLPILCNSPLATCFAPRKWVEGVFSLTFQGQELAEAFQQERHAGELVRHWRVLSLHRDNAFWDMVRSDAGSDVPLHGQVVRALRYFEQQGSETHWHRVDSIGPDADPGAHFLAVLQPSPGD